MRELRAINKLPQSSDELCADVEPVGIIALATAARAALHRPRYRVCLSKDRHGYEMLYMRCDLATGTVAPYEPHQQ